MFLANWHAHTLGCTEAGLAGTYQEFVVSTHTSGTSGVRNWWKSVPCSMSLLHNQVPNRQEANITMGLKLGDCCY